MNQPGELDPVYVAARKALLDALEALAEQLDAFVLVGAQAVYFHAGEGDLLAAPFTSDADLALDPRALADEPLLERFLRQAAFEPTGQPGSWLVAAGEHVVTLDLMVPAGLDQQGRRAAKLGEHGDRTARRAKGLEAAIVDRVRHLIHALDPADPREHELWIAGPAALLVAKLHKIGERIGQSGRERDKDALDVLRLLRSTATATLGARLVELLADHLAGPPTQEALVTLRAHFLVAVAEGCRMAGRAAVPEDPGEIAQSCAFLARDLAKYLQECGM